MGFIDEAVITVVSGNGGKGCVSFRRERFIPKGGPDGGDGGNGGDIIIKASKKIHTLSDFSSKKHFKSQNGSPGKGKNQTGKDGSNTLIEVPLGTTVYDKDSGEMIADLIRDDEEILIVSGGRGGKGNRHFTTSTNRAPRFAQPGIPGSEKRLLLTLRYIADIGLIGLPNAGKSTLLSRLTKAHPKIGRYPFTTLVPNLGVIEYEDKSSLILADIPGLVEGAGEGKGLGHRFLKHIERTGFLLHIIDIAQDPSQDPLYSFHLIQKELEKYHPSLTGKGQMVLINKIDLIKPGQFNIDKIRSELKRIDLESLPISALKGDGLDELKKILKNKILKK